MAPRRSGGRVKVELRSGQPWFQTRMNSRNHWRQYWPASGARGTQLSVPSQWSSTVAASGHGVVGRGRCRMCGTCSFDWTRQSERRTIQSCGEFADLGLSRMAPFLKIVGIVVVLYLAVAGLLWALQGKLLFPRGMVGPGASLPPNAERLALG